MKTYTKATIAVICAILLITLLPLAVFALTHLQHEHRWTQIVDVPDSTLAVCSCGEAFQSDSAWRVHAEEKASQGDTTHVFTRTGDPGVSHIECVECGEWMIQE